MKWVSCAVMWYADPNRLFIQLSTVGVPRTGLAAAITTRDRSRFRMLSKFIELTPEMVQEPDQLQRKVELGIRSLREQAIDYDRVILNDVTSAMYQSAIASMMGLDTVQLANDQRYNYVREAANGG